MNGRTRLPGVGISFDAGARSIVFQLGNSHPIFAPNHTALRIRPLALSSLSLDDNAMRGSAKCSLEEVRTMLSSYWESLKLKKKELVIPAIYQIILHCFCLSRAVGAFRHMAFC